MGKTSKKSPPTPYWPSAVILGVILGVAVAVNAAKALHPEYQWSFLAPKLRLVLDDHGKVKEWPRR